MDAYLLLYWGFDASWESVRAVGAAEIGKPDVVRQFEPVLEALEAGCWLYYFEGDCIYWIAQPALALDERRRLHHADGPAFAIDGWSEYFWHGVLVDERTVMRPHELTATAALEERNAEVRRVMIERIGHERFIRESKAERLHRDTDGAGQKRELLRVPIPDDEPMVVVHVTCPSTGHEYFLRVPPDTKRCDEAVAWTFGMSISEYAPVAES